MRETKYKGYFATEDGEIISMKSRKPHKMKITYDDWGYPRIQIWNKGKPLFKRIHILVCEAYHGPRPEGMQIDHIDGNKLNSRPNNLEYVTPSENLRRAYAMGLRKRQTKLSDGTWIELVTRINEGEKIRFIAKEYGVHESTIQGVLRGYKRKWMTNQGIIQRQYKQTQHSDEHIAEAIRAMINGMSHKEIVTTYNIKYSSWMEIVGKRRRKNAWKLVEGSQTIESTREQRGSE